MASSEHSLAGLSKITRAPRLNFDICWVKLFLRKQPDKTFKKKLFSCPRLAIQFEEVREVLLRLKISRIICLDNVLNFGLHVNC